MDEAEVWLWGYQLTFMTQFGSRADRAFETLGVRLQTQFLQYAFPSDPSSGLGSFLWPSESIYDKASFADIHARADSVEQERQRGRQLLVMGDKRAQDDYVAAQRRSALREAAQAIVDAQAVLFGRCAFCASPVKLGEYWVVSILDYDSSQLTSLARLSRTSAAMDRWHSITLYRSLAEALIAELLEECNSALQAVKGWESYPDIRLVPDELVRRSGARFLLAPLTSVGHWYSTEGIMTALDRVSALTYESGVARGGILLAGRDNPSIERIVTLRTEVSLIGNERGTRKLLEATSDDLLLLAAPSSIGDYGLSVYGLGRVSEGYDEGSESIFRIRFLDHTRWSVEHGTCSLMTVVSGLPSVPRPAFDSAKLSRLLGQVFSGMEECAIAKICELADAATKQRHGTMIVVASNAEAESVRLATQSTAIHEIDLDAQLLAQLSSLDGAILLDTSARCHAIGVILDGVATAQGTPSRGARFNSAIRYCAHYGDRAESALAIVVSEDGSVDIVPDLPPKLPRSVLDALVSGLQALADDTDVSVKKYNALMVRITSLEFYFSAELCDLVNGLSDAISHKLRQTGLTTVMLVHRPLTPHPEMNDSYLVDG